MLFSASALARLLQVSSPGGVNEGASRRYGRTLASLYLLDEHTKTCEGKESHWLISIFQYLKMSYCVSSMVLC